MASIEQIEMARYSAELDEKAARALIVKALKDALEKVDAE
jgi:hypothetical protein